MIATIVSAFTRSLWGRYLMVGLAILAGVKVYGEVKERDGRRSERARSSVETIKTMRRMQDAAARVLTDRASVARSMRDRTF